MSSTGHLGGGASLICALTWIGGGIKGLRNKVIVSYCTFSLAERKVRFFNVQEVDLLIRENMKRQIKLV